MRGKEFSRSEGSELMAKEKMLVDSTAGVDDDVRGVTEKDFLDALPAATMPWGMSLKDTRASPNELSLLSDDGISLEMMDDDSPQTTAKQDPCRLASETANKDPFAPSPPSTSSSSPFFPPRSPEHDGLPPLLPFPRSRANSTKHRPTISSISTATHTLVSIIPSYPPPSPHDPLVNFSEGAYSIVGLAQSVELSAHRRSYSEPIPTFPIQALPLLRAGSDVLPTTPETEATALDDPQSPVQEQDEPEPQPQPEPLSDPNPDANESHQISSGPSAEARVQSPGPPSYFCRSASGPLDYEPASERGSREPGVIARSVSAPVELGSNMRPHGPGSLLSPRSRFSSLLALGVTASSPYSPPLGGVPLSPGSSSKSSAVHPEPLSSSHTDDAVTCALDVSSRQSALGMLMEIDGRFMSPNGGGGALATASSPDSHEARSPATPEERESPGGPGGEEESRPRPMPLKLSHWMAVAGGKASWSLGGAMIPGFDEEGDVSVGEERGESVDWLRGVVAERGSGEGGGHNLGEEELPLPVVGTPSKGAGDVCSPLAPSSARKSHGLFGEVGGKERSGSNAGDVVRPPRSKVVSINESGRQDSTTRRWKFMDGGMRASHEKDRSREVSVNAPQMRKRLTPLRTAGRQQLGQLSLSVSLRSMQVAKVATSVLTRARGVLRFAIRKSKGEMSVKQLHLHKVLGQGAFGVVHLVTRRWHGKDMFALKSMDKRDLFKRNEMDHVMCEKYALQTLHHPFIVQMRKSFQDPMRVYFLLEFVSGGDLFSRLEERGRLPENSTRFYACEVLIALSYMHDLSFVYRDLKPENILIDGEGHVKLTDLGFARKLAPSEKRYTFVGTPDYLAPEIVQNKGHDKAVDFWAFGVLLYELMAGYTPFYAPSVTEKYSKIVLGNIRWPTSFDAKATSLIQALLHPDPARRLGSGPRGAREVMDHAWFEGVDWSAAAARRLQPPYVPPTYKHVKPKRYIDRLELYRWHGGNGGLVGLKGSSAVSPDSAPSSPLSLEMQRHFEAF